MNVLVTGASSGIGKATTKKYLETGNKVIAISRDLKKLEELKYKYSDQLVLISLDVRQQSELNKKLLPYQELVQNLDVLVNNAGVAFGLSPFHETQSSDWEAMVQTNNLGLLYCTQAVLPHMVKRNRGHIINIGSVAGTYAYPGGNVYGASKAFVHQFTQGLKADLAGTNVRSTCIEPGMVSNTEFSITRFGGNKDRADQVYQGTNPLKPEDIAEIVFWVSTQPPHVNITTLEVLPVDQSFAALQVQRRKN